MSTFSPMTFKKLVEKYPEMKNDIDELKEDKNTGLNYNRLLFFALGCITMLVYNIFKIGGCHV